MSFPTLPSKHPTNEMKLYSMEDLVLKFSFMRSSRKCFVYIHIDAVSSESNDNQLFISSPD